ncbi:integrin alphabeta-propellor repeat protein [Haloferula helveola]|uniref:Integrin alphabeta-propellor repeat protein n=1 Tax=Haloferula helveola TaxID=490095 RepID=A0ABN6H309_9BACT|nr:integrin alphabeta-propellor repeat protein [Haloferula helveola]
MKHALPFAALLISSTVSGFAVQPGVSPPPGELDLELPLGSRQVVSVDIENPQAASALSWEVIFRNSPADPIERLLSDLGETPEPLLSVLPDRYEFPGGTSGYQLTLSGGFSDTGNRIFLNGSRINYSDFVPITVTAGAGSARYTTAKLPGLFIFSGELSGVTEFAIEGRPDQGSAAEVSVDDFTVEVAGTPWRAFVKRITDSASPSALFRRASVHQLILLPDSPGLTRTFDAGNESDGHIISNLPPSTPLHYFYFSRPEGSAYNRSVLSEFAETYLRRLLPGPEWCQPAPTDGTLPPLGSGQLDFVIDAGLSGIGSHAAEFAIVETGTDPDTLPATDWKPFTLEVSPPPFRLGSENLEFSTLEGYNPATGELEVLPAEGESNLPLLSVTATADWLTMTPTGDGRWQVEAQTDGLAPGTHLEHLAVSDGTSTASVPVWIEVESRNIISFLADPIRPRLYALSKLAERPGFLLVFDPATQSETTAIPLGLEPIDFDLNETASELIVLNNSDPSISRVDLETLSVTQTIPLGEFVTSPDSFDGRIADGPGSILYYVDEDRQPKLHVFDLASGTVLQKFSADLVPQTDPGTSYGFGDIAVDSGRSRLFAWTRQDTTGSSTGSHAVSFDIAPDGTLSNFTRSVIRNRGTFRRDPDNTPTLLSEDGRTLVIKDSRLDPDALDAELARFPAVAYALTRGGELAGLSNRIYNLREDTTTTLTGYAPNQFTPDYAWFTSIGSDGEVVWTDLHSVVTPAELGMRFEPADDGGAVLPGELRWPPAREVRSYEVYVGTDPDAVAAAVSGSPEYLGSFSGNSAPFPPGLVAGTVYYWKVIPVGGSDPDFDPVRSFTVLPVSLPRRDLIAGSVAGASRRLETFPIDCDASTGWELGSTVPWISAEPASGAGSATPTVVLDASALDTGVHRGDLLLTVNGVTTVIPVELTVFGMQVREMDVVPGEDTIWVYSQGTDELGFLVAYNTSSSGFETVIPTGLAASPLAVHAREDRIYVAQTNPGIIYGFDRSTLEQVFTYRFEPRQPPTQTSHGIRSLAPGPDGRIVVEILEPNRSALLLVDTTNGDLLDEFELGDIPAGSGVSSADGNFYFHADANFSNADISKFDLAGDRFTELASYRFAGYSSSGGFPVRLSADGTRIAWNGGILDTDLNLLNVVPQQLHAISGNGAFVASNRDLYNAANGLVVGRLPAFSNRRIFDGSGEVLYTFDSQVWVTPLSEFAALPDRDVVPTVSDGSTIRINDVELAWAPEATAASYKVFFGTDRDLVAAADSDSSEFLGTMTSSRWTGDLPDIGIGGTYYWRIDMQGVDGTRTGSVWEFSVAPIETIPSQFTIPTLTGRPIERQIMSFRSAGSTDWEASTSDAWIRLESTSGTVSQELAFEIDTTGLPVGTRIGSIAITSGGETIAVPVEVDVVQLDIERLAIDPSRARVYGLNDQLPSNGWNHLLAIDPESAEVLDLIRIGRNVTDLVIDPVTDRLIASNDGYPVTRVVDLASFAELAPLELGDDVFTLEIDPDRRLLIAETERSQVSVRALDLDTLAQVTSFSGSAGVTRIDPARNVYYRAENFSGASRLKKYDLNLSPPVQIGEVTHSASLNEILMTNDGSLLVCRDTVYNPDLEIVNALPAEPVCLSPSGQLAVSTSSIYWLDDGTFVDDLPFIADEATFTADGGRLILFNRTDRRLESIPLDPIIQLPGPTPRDGRWLGASPETLSWQPVDGANAYTVTLRSPSRGTLVFSGLTVPQLGIPFQFIRGEIVDWSVRAEFSDRGPVDLPEYQFGIRIPQHSTLEGAIPYDPGFGPGHLLARSGSNSYVLRTFDHDSGESVVIEDNPVVPPAGIPTSGQRTLIDRFRCYHTLPGQTAEDSSTGVVFSFDASLYNRAHTSLLPRPDGINRDLGTGLAVSGGLLLTGGNASNSNRSRVIAYTTQPAMVQTQALVPSEEREFDRFGSAIALHGNAAAITSGGRFSFSNPVLPAIFMFDRDPVSGRWQETQKLEVPDAGSRDFIRQLAMNDRFLVVVNSNRDEVHIFERADGGAWAFQTTFSAANQRGATASFGSAIALAGNRLFVGDAEARVDGESGAVFTFIFDGSAWSPGVPVLPPDPSVRRRNFGLSLAARDRWLFVGAGIANTGAFTDTTGHLFDLDPAPNHTPYFQPAAVTQVVAGSFLNLEVSAGDADGTDGLVMGATQLPDWIEFTDLGNGTGTLTGTANAPAGSQHELQLVVTDPSGARSYDTFRLTVVEKANRPIITQGPDDLALEDGQDIVLRAEAAGIEPLAWQWFHNSQPIQGATRPTLEIAEAGTGNQGAYHVEVSNAAGGATSRTSTVTVGPADRFNGPWAATGNSMRRSGFHPARLKRHTFVPVWSRRLPANSLTQAAIADGRVVVSGIGTPGSLVFALDFNSGEVLWSTPFDSTRSANPPSIHRDRIYYQESDISNSRLWSLAADTGSVIWEGNWITQFESYDSPAVSDSGVWIGGGYGDGLYGFDLDGTSRFYEVLPQESDRWTPILSGDRLFSWVEGTLREHDPETGKLLWSCIGTGGKNIFSGTIRGDRAFVSTGDGLSCVDLIGQKRLWTVPGLPYCNPAVFGSLIYAVAGSTVRSFSTEDGTEQPEFVLPSEDPIAIAQPVLLHGHLIVSTQTRTYIFDRETIELLQVIEVGGNLSYSEGKLIIVDAAGEVHAWFANGAPEFSPDLPDQVNSGVAAPPFALAVGAFTGDPDPADALVWAIVDVTRPEIFNTLAIDPGSGDLTVIYNPWESGSSDVTVSASDPVGNVTESTITFTVPPHPLPALEIEESMILNRQTGLYEHTITVTNPALREIAGFDLTITGLPVGVEVHNASGEAEGAWSVQHRQPLAPGASITLILEYYAPVRGTVLEPQVAASIVTLPEQDPAAEVPGLAVDRCELVDDGLLIEFISVPGALYEIQYSDDFTLWKTSPTRIRAAGNRVQWIDRGPPRTDSSPGDKSSRFYRVRELPETE